jgi:transaldolase
MKNEIALEQQIRQRVHHEREQEERLPAEALWARIQSGNDAGARGTLLFFTEPSALSTRLSETLLRLTREMPGADSRQKVLFLRFLTFLAIDLATAVPEWVMRKSLPKSALAQMAESALLTLGTLGAQEPEAQQELLAALRADAVGRLRAEGLPDGPELAACAQELAGSSLGAYAQRIIDEASRSNLRAAAAAHQEGGVATVLGNDYAEFLRHVIWLGGSFVTTNPVLIKLAWDIDPPYWDAHVASVILSRFSRPQLGALLAGGGAALTEAIETINTSVTISVVERNCRMLRPIFLVTEGAQGYVSLQVNPTAHDDPRKMAEDAARIYEELERRLGGVPNVVIKVPSTAAGVRAAEKLTQRGIGVTITLTFSLFQSLPFARVLDAGHALVSYIALMNGRLAFPVRDEMAREKVAGGVEAARWAGVEVARKAQERLYAPKSRGGLGIDPGKVKIMIASLRIYGDWIPDISELWGVPLITIFPNVRRAYDARQRPLVPEAVSGKTPEDELRILLKSEIFRQAWWTESDGELGRPDRPLSLDDADNAAVVKWAPVHETLTQFIGTYREMSDRVKTRMAALAQSRPGE